MENNQCILISTGLSRKVLSRIKSRRRGRVKLFIRKKKKINNGTKLATSHVINPCRLSGERRAQRGRFIIAFRPSLPGIHALLVWMSQLTSSDNCEPRALSKGTTVIVLIGPPSLCWERKMLSNVIATQHLKVRHAHIEHQKGRCLLFIYQGQSFGTPPTPPHWNKQPYQ